MDLCTAGMGAGRCAEQDAQDEPAADHHLLDVQHRRVDAAEGVEQAGGDPGPVAPTHGDEQAVAALRAVRARHVVVAPRLDRAHATVAAGGGGARRAGRDGSLGMDLGLSGKVAVVTGSRTGIGLAVVPGARRRGHARGWRLARTGGAPIEGVEHLRSDLTEPGAVEGLVQHAVERYGSLSVLVNNAGTGTIRSGSVDATDADWASLFALNLMVAVRATRAALPHLCVEGGAIANISSINAVAPSGDIADYSASKAALNSFGKSVATEYAPKGVRVVSVSPGPTRTDLWMGPGGPAQTYAARSGVRPRTSCVARSRRSHSAGWPTRRRSPTWSRSSSRRGRPT